MIISSKNGKIEIYNSPFKIPSIRGWMDIIMVSDYRRGWEDALDTILELRDWNKAEMIRDRLRKQRVKFYEDGP